MDIDEVTHNRPRERKSHSSYEEDDDDEDHHDNEEDPNENDSDTMDVVDSSTRVDEHTDRMRRLKERARRSTSLTGSSDNGSSKRSISPAKDLHQQHSERNNNRNNNQQQQQQHNPAPRPSLSINDLCNSMGAASHDDRGLLLPSPSSRHLNNGNGHPINGGTPYMSTSDSERSEDERMAAEVLGGLRNATSQPSHPGSYHLHQPGSSSSDPRDRERPDHFMSRVSAIPLVNRSITQISTAYEATKNASRVVKYSAESVETGMKTITKPVFNKLEPALASVDRFACASLDKLDFDSIRRPRSHSQSSVSSLSSLHSLSSISSVDLLQVPNVPLNMDTSHNGHSPGSELGPPLTAALSSPLNHSGVNDRAVVERGDMSTAPHIPRTPRSSSFSLTSVRNSVSQLSRYMFSEETLRGLRYCLEWLQYASAHIERQVQALMTYISSLASFNSSNTSPTPPLSPNGQLTLPPPSLLSTIKREVVETIRRVVDVVGRYAAIYLPAEGRGRVRGFILGLPGRWASLSGGSGRQPHGMLEVPHVASSSSSMTDTTVPSPTTMSSPTNGTNSNGNATMMMMAADMEHLEAEAKKVLALANESGNMVKGVERVFRSTVENLVPPPPSQQQQQTVGVTGPSVSLVNGPPQPLEDELSPCTTTTTTTTNITSSVGSGHASGPMDHTREEESVDDEARKRRRKGKSSG
ncbi:hypothetical protein HDU85_005291 [Gaertneriomyces sp. JEL0708]|nr:hypothetical protein HDU85_005291 [Gaertneriomyces sp. JEL0708]